MQHRSWMISPIIVGTLSFCAVVVEAQEQSEPDIRKESRLHQIYKSLNEAGTPEEDWQNALNSGNAQTYTIQEGDTLWGISETFFNDPQFYPKIWSLNGQAILNPHEINPEQVVQFVEGTVGEPPSLSLQAPGASAVISEEQSEESSTSVASEEIPEGTPRSKPFQALPSSFAPLDYDPSALTKFEFHIKPPEKSPQPVEVYVDTYLHEGSFPSLGVVTENENGLAASGDEQFLFVKMDTVPTQNRFLAVRKNAQIKDPVSGNVATQIQVAAEIELQTVVNSSKTLYRAKVLKLFNKIDIGIDIVADDLMSVSSKEESPLTSVKATIVGGAFDDDRQLFANEEVVYINLGSDAGIAAGQVLPVYRNQKLRTEETEAEQNHRMIGRLKIIKTTAKFASALVTYAIEDIRVGDKTSSE